MNFPSVVEVLNQLKHDRDTYLRGTDEQRYEAALPLLKVMSHKLSPESSSLEALNFLFAVRRHSVLIGVAESIHFSAVIPYDSELLNGTLAAGRWNTHLDPITRTLEISTASLAPHDDSDFED